MKNEIEIRDSEIIAILPHLLNGDIACFDALQSLEVFLRNKHKESLGSSDSTTLFNTHFQIGMGFYFLCGIYGATGTWAGLTRGSPVAASCGWGCGRLEKLCRAKAINFWNITQQQQHRYHSDLDLIPNEIKLKILDCINSRELFALMLVNNKWCNLANYNYIWDNLTSREHYNYFPRKENVNGKEFYRQQRFRTNMQVFAKILSVNNYDYTVTVRVDQISNVKNLKNAIFSEMKNRNMRVNENFSLTLRGKELKDEQSLHEAGVRREGTLRIK
jgi:hypothetical protein